MGRFGILGWMRRLLVLLAFLPALFSADLVQYEIRFPNAVHHEAEVSVIFPDLPAGPLQIRMSRTSPGRYALHEFARNVHRVKAFDGTGKALDVTRPNPHQWDVAGHDGTVKFTYTLFGDRADGTCTGIDRSHAHLNMPATFAWARGLRDRAIRIRFAPLEGARWKAATQLKPTAEPFVFEAPNLDYFMDSPTEFAGFTEREWKASDGERTASIRLVVHHAGTEADVDRYAAMAQAVVNEEIGLFGELPEFDYGEYTFLCDYLPWVDGDGMEHRNSTYCTSRESLAQSAGRLIGTLAHEFIHAWNVERLRPASLEPFDFEAESVPEELWFCEGFTSYYTPLILRRAGLEDDGQFVRAIAGLLNEVLSSPGRKVVSPVEASRLAAFHDGGMWKDEGNARNTFVSYYPYGAAVGLALDLTLRTQFGGVTLDDYMRAMWREFGRTERPFTMADLERVLGEVTRDETFARRFFASAVRGHDLPDFAPLLAKAGFAVRLADPGMATVGAAHLSFTGKGAVLSSATLAGDPLYQAGLDRGAVILEADGRKFTNQKAWDRFLDKKKPGDKVRVAYEQRGETGTVTMKLEECPQLEVVPFERAGRPLTGEARRFREAWLGSRARR